MQQSDASLHRALSDESRVRLLDEIRAAGEPPDATRLAATVGLHPNTVRSHLRVLIDAGLVTAAPEERHTRGRPRIVFTATEQPEPRPVAGYRMLAEVLASELSRAGDDSADRAEQAGRAWGRYLVSRRPPQELASADAEIETVVELLEELGFDPTVELADDGNAVIMQHCPFGEVADHYQRVVCAVHLGLLQGACEELGPHARAGELEPYVRPGLCAARLERVGSRS